MRPDKLVLVVVDSLRTDMLERTVEAGEAPNFAALLERGTLVRDCVSTFPSVTPVANSEIATGAAPSEHWISGMNWYSRLERRYVEYGSSLEATRAFGLFRTLYDVVYNMNLGHLSPNTPTIFEQLGDEGVRTACTPFLIYRGRRRHQLSLEGMMRRVALAANFRHAVWGPDELFYGELYASRRVPCKPTMARPGTRDAYSACVGAELVADDLFDFMLLGLPDNDYHSHRYGPEAQVESIAHADRSFGEIVDAAGGMDDFLRRYAVILTADHAQTPVDHNLPLIESLSADWRVLQPNSERPEEAELAVSPIARAGGVYVLTEEERNRDTHERVRAHLHELDGVDLVAWLSDEEGAPLLRRGAGSPDPTRVQAVVESDGGTLRFRPGRGAADERGVRWTLQGELGVLDAELSGRRVRSDAYPDGLGRLWSALMAPNAGDVVLSAAVGYECVDWGGTSHVPGGSHGSLERGDSVGPLLFVGCEPGSERRGRKAAERPWTLRDIAGLVLGYFGAGSNGRPA